MEFSTSLRVFGFSKLSKGCSSHDHGNTVEGKDTWEVIAMTEVTFAFATSGLAGSSTWVPGTVLTTTQHFLMFDVLSFEYELKGVWGWWDKEECSLHKVPDKGTGDA